MNKCLGTALLVGVWLLWNTPVLGQQRTQYWGLTAGLSPWQLKDSFRSEYTYRGTGVGVQAYYGQSRPQTRWQLEAAYTRASLQSVVSRKASAQQLDLMFDYQWRLSPTGQAGKFQYWVGPGLCLFNNTTNYSPDSDVSTVVTTAAAALGVSARASYQLSARHSIQGQAFVSAVGVVYRPQYAYFGREMVAASWLGRAPLLDARATYHYQVSDRLRLVGTYHLNYFHYAQPRRVIGLRQSVGVGLQYTF